MTTQSAEAPASERRLAPSTGRRRILFVDDDELILRSMERLLRRTAAESGWELCFKADGESALEELERAPVDLILTDANLGAMSGTAVLRKVQERYPGTMRVLLSGHHGLDMLRTALPHAHQFLPKPCDAQMLKATIESACGLRALLAREEMREVVGSSNELPSAPRTYVELSNALSNPGAGARVIAEIIERDIATSARVLQLVSSAFYGLPRSVTSVGGAVAYLGVEVVKAIVLSVEVSRMFPLTQPAGDFSIEKLQQHSMKVAQFAKRILGFEPGGDVLLVAGLLQDVGQLILASRSATRFATALSLSRGQKRPLYDLERELFGATHAEIGGYLLGLWGLPERVVATVAHHLEPQRQGGRVFDATAALYVANLLVPDPNALALEEVPPGCEALDLGYLRSLGVAHKVDEWRYQARAFTGTTRVSSQRVAARA